MKLQGNLRKMRAEVGETVRYSLELGNGHIDLGERLGQTLKIEYLQQIECVHCGRDTRKSFNQGYCYPCFTRLAQCDRCIMAPENSSAAGLSLFSRKSTSVCSMPNSSSRSANFMLFDFRN